MTVDIVHHEESDQWGSANVQVTRHPRQYKSGKVIVPTYSAQCGSRRRRLRKYYENIYTMKCKSDEVEVDINSGHYVKSVAICVDNEVPPKDASLITAAHFDRIRGQSQIHGFANIAFKVDTLGDEVLNWWVIYTNPRMSEGLGMAIKGGQHLYIRFK